MTLIIHCSSLNKEQTEIFFSLDYVTQISVNFVSCRPCIIPPPTISGVKVLVDMVRSWCSSVYSQNLKIEDKRLNSLPLTFFFKSKEVSKLSI